MPSKPRRWIPRFSLRTLLIVVLVYALLWTLTATWGVRDVISSMEFGQGFSVSKAGNTVHIVSKSNDGYDWKNRVFATCPFCVYITAHGRMNGHEIDAHAKLLWFFGYQRLFDELNRHKK